MTPTHFDCLLLKCTQAPTQAQLATWLHSLALARPVHAQQASTPAAENGQPMHHVYLDWGTPQHLAAYDPAALAARWHALHGSTLSVSRLQRVLDLAGTAHGQRAPTHYVVETDPGDGWDQEIADWYAQEHLPGLAAVPGTVRAQRCINLDHAPHSFACYDLTDLSVLETPQWLAVRGTAWSDRCRPHFTNTLRTPFAHLVSLTF